MLTGRWIDVRTIYPWPFFWHMLRSEGHIITNVGAAPYHAISYVELLPKGAAHGDNVVQLRSPDKSSP